MINAFKTRQKVSSEIAVAPPNDDNNIIAVQLTATCIGKALEHFVCKVCMDSVVCCNALTYCISCLLR